MIQRAENFGLPQSLSPYPVGRRIMHQLRSRGLAARTLAERTGVDAHALDKIIAGERQPTMELIWKIANALDVRPGSLLAFGYSDDFAISRAEDGPRFASDDGSYVSRALSPFRGNSGFEFYGIDIAAGAHQHFEAHPPGTFETLTIHAGEIEIAIGREPPQRLRSGDWIQFQADVPHSYRNIGKDSASLYIVIAFVSSGTA